MGLFIIIVSIVLVEKAVDRVLADELILHAARAGIITWVAASKCQPFSDTTSVADNVF